MRKRTTTRVIKTSGERGNGKEYRERGERGRGRGEGNRKEGGRAQEEEISVDAQLGWRSPGVK